MRISERTIAALARIATGDAIDNSNSAIAPYQSGPQLVRFFNELGSNARYTQRFPSRWQFAETEIRRHNGKSSLTNVVEAILDPRRFLDSQYPVEGAVDYANTYLNYDNLRVVRVGKFYKLQSTKGAIIELKPRAGVGDALTQAFISEHIEKCDQKLLQKDYSGAITNARSMVELVLLALENELSPEHEEFDGDLTKLYRRVQKSLNLHPGRTDIADSLKSVLSGLNSIVTGLAPLSNRMGDRHGTKLRPATHHAKLAVNAAKTLVEFLFDTFEYQKSKNTTSQTKQDTTNGQKAH